MGKICYLSMSILNNVVSQFHRCLIQMVLSHKNSNVAINPVCETCMHTIVRLTMWVYGLMLCKSIHHAGIYISKGRLMLTVCLLARYAKSPLFFANAIFSGHQCFITANILFYMVQKRSALYI